MMPLHTVAISGFSLAIGSATSFSLDNFFFLVFSSDGADNIFDEQGRFWDL